MFPNRDSLRRLIGAICCDVNDAWEVETHFIDAQGMKNLTAEEPPAPVEQEEMDRMIRLAEEAFAKALNAK